MELEFSLRSRLSDEVHTQGEAKWVVYRYGEGKDDERVFDGHGRLRVPKDGELVIREGKRWTVTHSTVEHSIRDGERLPVLWIYLKSRDLV